MVSESEVGYKTKKKKRKKEKKRTQQQQQHCYKKKSKRTTRFKRIWNMSELTRSILK